MGRSQSGQESQSAGQVQAAEQAQNGQQGDQGQGGQSQGANASGGLQPGGPGGPRTWIGGLRGAGDGSDPGRPGIETSDPSADPSPSIESSRRQALRELDELRQEVRGQPDALTDIQELTRDLQRLGAANFAGNPALVDQLRAQVLTAMDNLELRLRRDLDQQRSDQVRNGDSLRVPQGYQESVAEYFRRLSKNH